MRYGRNLKGYRQASSVAWYLRAPENFAFNVMLPEDGSPEDGAQAVREIDDWARKHHRRAALWYDKTMVAMAEPRRGDLPHRTRIVPAMRHLISLPWRT